MTKIETSKKNRIDQALIRFFICCGIPFSAVGHSYFIDIIQSLCYSYIPPNRTTLTLTILNHEISTVLLKINKKLEYKNNLKFGKSIYAFVIITPSRKQYIHALVDESSKSHTGSFNASEIERVLISI
ncbi:hypothetical protein C2G38_2235835 [Gigaspora rosea]|uniref:Uncharacterized protein n=1 Tax=Gigaspora rosea TaxID=44941 RepID=A0A397TPE2_9GLOM|nr:hypothetical protein C2G38_2235835 [Gigaspora rosea]